MKVFHSRHGEGFECVAAEVKRLQIALQPEERVLGEAWEDVAPEVEVDDAGAVEGVWVELADVVAAQVERAQRLNLVNSTRYIGEAAVLDCQKAERFLPPEKKIFTHLSANRK